MIDKINHLRLLIATKESELAGLKLALQLFDGGLSAAIAKAETVVKTPLDGLIQGLEMFQGEQSTQPAKATGVGKTPKPPTQKTDETAKALKQKWQAEDRASGRMDASSGGVEVNGMFIDMTENELKYMQPFIDSADGFVSVQDLSKLSDGVLSRFHTVLTKLREKLGPANATIESERGSGYRFVTVEA